MLLALWGILECLVLFLARNQIGRIFSNDRCYSFDSMFDVINVFKLINRDVIDLIGKSLKIVCVVVFFDDLQVSRPSY